MFWATGFHAEQTGQFMTLSIACCGVMVSPAANARLASMSTATVHSKTRFIRVILLLRVTWFGTATTGKRNSAKLVAGRRGRLHFQSSKFHPIMGCDVKGLKPVWSAATGVPDRSPVETAAPGYLL